MKKKIVSLLLVVLLCVLSPIATLAQTPITLIVNGKKAPDNISPYIKDDYTMVPIRFVGETLGGDVYWHEELECGMQGVTISPPDDEYGEFGLTMYINKPIGAISEGFYNLGASPEVKHGITYVPVRIVSDLFSFNINWNGKTRTVTLVKKPRKSGDPLKNYWNEKAGQRFDEFTFKENPTDRDYQRIFEY